MAEKKTTTEKVETTVSTPKVETPTKAETVDVEAFIARKLKALNNVEDKARAQRDAARVLVNRKRGV